MPPQQAGTAHARKVLTEAAAAMRDTAETAAQRLYAAEAPAVQSALAEFPLRERPHRSGPWPVRVERPRALYGAWYEFFPRSEGATLNPPRSGTFRTAAMRLPAVAAMGFDVVYLPPIHPIGHTFRKGPNNTLTPGPDDPGSPWAIGSEAGGHDTVHPDLGTMADFEHFMSVAADNGLEIALDFALQASPDHPWVAAHPEWFVTRADGSIAYAENPPKKYQDIYPIAFDADFDGLVDECERILRLWMGKGVRIFRVDNPHTKTVEFWEVLFARIYATDPDVLFLAEAFTRPAMMRTLGTVGFHQSYTYFTWRNTKWELETYFTELSTFAADYMRPNCFVNTPDINPFFLQSGNKAAFAIRATLAALLAPTYGVYAGFEVYEHKPLAPGKEEYLDSEKFQYRPRDWAAASHTSLVPYLTLLNQIRREHPAFHELRNLRFESHRQLADDRVVEADRGRGRRRHLRAGPQQPAGGHPAPGPRRAGLRPRRASPGPRPHHRPDLGMGRAQLHPARPQLHLCTCRCSREDAMTPSNTPADPGTPTPDAAVPPAAPAPAAPAAATGPAKLPVDTGDIDRLVDGASASPHSILGAHPYEGGVTIRVLRPMAKEVVVVTPLGRHPMLHEHRGVWIVVLPGDTVPAYTIDVDYGQGLIPADDPYRFLPTLGELDLHLIGEGRHEELWKTLGAHERTYDSPFGPITGTSFAVWAPSAEGVRVVGRLQRLGRHRAPDALHGQHGHLGAVHPEHRRRHHLQVLHPGQGLGLAREGGPDGLPHRGAAVHRVGRLHVGLRLG